MISLEIGLESSNFGIQIVLKYQQIMNVPLNVGQLTLLCTFRRHRRGDQRQAFRCILFDLTETAIMTIPQETGRVEVPLTRVCQRWLKRMAIMLRHLADGNLGDEIGRRYRRECLVWVLRRLPENRVYPVRVRR
jgi:hypothetical protein